MINYIKPALEYFENLDIIKTVNDVIRNGSEHDLQLEYLNQNSIKDLKIYLMDKVDYKI